MDKVISLARAEGKPDVLVLHAGGNDMGAMSQQDLVHAMKQDVDKIRSLFGGVVIVWSEMIGGIVVRHKSLESRLPGYFAADKEHLSVVGTDIFNLDLADGIERALILQVGGACRA
ncbi:hypothetical protein XELAEV_18031651mg [Xenopus laevis]|uniref:Uncharacterized protein n=1 Tax=Xenopus laevis TaxID=8355 RepID=A0A974CMZ6_XENLA|nr:hypothetical protein XELAEV_18031651mg [Xenopus laevis]